MGVFGGLLDGDLTGRTGGGQDVLEMPASFEEAGPLEGDAIEDFAAFSLFGVHGRLVSLCVDSRASGGGQSNGRLVSESSVVDSVGVSGASAVAFNSPGMDECLWKVGRLFCIFGVASTELMLCAELFCL